MTDEIEELRKQLKQLELIQIFQTAALRHLIKHIDETVPDIGLRNSFLAFHFETIMHNAPGLDPRFADLAEDYFRRLSGN